jgi:chaperonin GroEL (HSP60 family)
MEGFLKQEEEMLREMVDKIVKAGANVVLCEKGIDDMVQHFLARKGILAVRRIKKSDMEKLAKATGGKIVTKLDAITVADLGYANLVEERKVGEDKMTFIEGCKHPRAVTILIRGGTERIVAEAERSLHDALCVVRDVFEEPKIVAGGGSPELEVSRMLKKYAETLPGREQLAVKGFAEALEAIPMTLTENAGLDPIDILSELRARHEKGETWAGIEVNTGKIQDMSRAGVFEPLAVKKQIIKSATEASCMLLKIDDVIAAGKMRAPPTPPGGMPPGGGYPGAGEY